MSKSILIIEDNKDIRESTAEILVFSGYSVCTAAHGKAGVEMAIAQKPDLILCDIMMPELDGYGVLYLLSKNPATNTIPFIFLTAKSERLDFRKGMEMGADDYLTKPFDDMELLNAIESRLKKEEKQKIYFSQSLQQLSTIEAAAENGAGALKMFIESRKIKQVKKKQILYFEGDEPTGIYLILEGTVKTLKLSEDGRELITGIYTSGDYLGVPSLLTDEAYNEAAEALEDTTVCLLQKGATTDLLNRYPDIGQQFIRILSHNIREKEEQLLDLAYHSVRKRMAHILVRLCKGSGTAPQQIIISREELASCAAIATETVSRTLTDFKAEGLIDKKGSLILITDLDRLIKMKN